MPFAGRACHHPSRRGPAGHSETKTGRPFAGAAGWGGEWQSTGMSHVWRQHQSAAASLPASPDADFITCFCTPQSAESIPSAYGMSNDARSVPSTSAVCLFNRRRPIAHHSFRSDRPGRLSRISSQLPSPPSIDHDHFHRYALNLITHPSERSLKMASIVLSFSYHTYTVRREC